MTADQRPWWLRALEPLRTEAAMFRLLLRIAALAAVLIVVVLVARAIF